jgi:MFS family permease
MSSSKVRGLPRSSSRESGPRILAPAEAGGSRPRFFYGWIISLASSVGIGFGVSVYLPATTALLVGPLHKAMGWSAPQIFLALTFATTSTIIAAPMVGALIDRFGARRVVCISFVCEGLLIASCRYLDGDIHWLYARYAAFALFGTGTTAIGFSSLISRWFNRRRGVALGIALAGLGVGGVFWSLATQWLFDLVGWRDAFAWLGGVVVVLVAPLLALLLRDDPATLGLRIDGDDESQPVVTTAIPGVGVTLREALVTVHYWRMMATFFIISSATYGVMLNLVPLLVRRGTSPSEAAHVQASIWSALVVGRIFTGWLMDRFFAPRVALTFLIPPVIGAVMLATGATDVSALFAALMLGLSAGAEVDVMAFLVGRYYGLRNFGAIYSTYFSAYALGTSLGPVTAAALAGYTGGYSVPLYAIAGVFCVAAILLHRFPRFSAP